VSELPPAPLGPNWSSWGERLNQYLARNLSKLNQLRGGESAADDGYLAWDREGQYPVVSKNGEWRQIVLADGNGFLYNNSDIIAAASNTAYAINFTIGTGSGLTIGTSPNQSRIYFDEGGVYYLTFTAQIYSTNSSAQTFYFWPRINGTDVPLGATRAVLSANGETQPVTKGAVFEVNTGDYLEAMWATSDHTKGSLEAFAATAFSPADPSVTLSIVRISG
jgi:hypothetical protein